MNGVSVASEGAGTAVVGWIVVYIDDFAIVALDPVSDLVKDAIAEVWRIPNKPTVPFGNNKTVE